jgi:hypothetical protein
MPNGMTSKAKEVVGQTSDFQQVRWVSDMRGRRVWRAGPRRFVGVGPRRFAAVGPRHVWRPGWRSAYAWSPARPAWAPGVAWGASPGWGPGFRPEWGPGSGWGVSVGFGPRPWGWNRGWW